MNATFVENLQEFEVVGLRSDATAVRIIPSLGAKIFSLVNLKTGREWMWAPPGELRLLKSKTGDMFPDGTKIGADECLPTIVACKWRGFQLTDHGDAWTEAWELDRRAFDQGRIMTSLRMPVSPLEIVRTISLTEVAA